MHCSKFAPGFLCRCLCACCFQGKGLGAPGFISQEPDSLPLGGRVVHFLRLQSSWAFSEGFECLGSWCLRPPGVISCLPSEGAGSGARPHLLSVPELCRYLAESWLTFQIHLQELLQYKRQNPAQVTSPSSHNSALPVEKWRWGWGRSDSHSLNGDEGYGLGPS